MDGIIHILTRWSRWQASWTPRLGYPARSAVVRCCGYYSSFEDALDDVEAWRNRAVDAAVDELVPAQRAAVMRAYGIAAVFRFPRDNYEACLAAAHARLAVTLARRGVSVD